MVKELVRFYTMNLRQNKLNERSNNGQKTRKWKHVAREFRRDESLMENIAQSIKVPFAYYCAIKTHCHPPQQCALQPLAPAVVSPSSSQHFLFLYENLVEIWVHTARTALLCILRQKAILELNANLSFICRVDVPSLLWYHSSICMIYCGINCTILNCLWYNTLSISNRVCRVQSQLLCNISQSETGMRYFDDVKPSP